MSIQETKFLDIADAIREKDGTTAPIVANDFAARIRALPSFTVPLMIHVAGGEGSTVTATKGMRVLTATPGADGNVTFIVDEAGDWEIAARLGNKVASPKVITVVDRYSENLTFNESRLPEGYTEVEYLSNGTNNNWNYRPYFKMPSMSSAVKMEIQFVLGYRNAGDVQGIIGYYSSTNRYELYTYYDDICVQRGANTTKKILGPQVVGQKNTVILDYANKQSIFNGTVISGSPGTFWRSSSSFLFTDGRLPNKGLAIYSVKMWDASGELVFELVPCINPSGVPGMYNRVGKNFYQNTNTSSGAVPFVTGPVVA